MINKQFARTKRTKQEEQTMKKIIALLLACMMLIACTACAAKTEPAAPAEETAAEPAPAAEAPAAEEAADKRVGLVRQKGSEYQRVATHWEVGGDGKGRWLRGGGFSLPFSGFVVPAFWQVQLQT